MNNTLAPTMPAEIRSMPVTFGNVTYVLDYPHSIVMESALREVLEEKAYPYLEFMVDRPGVIIDVGGNVGAASLAFSLRYPGKDIYTFEPSRSIFPFLRQNAERLPSTRAFNVGLYDRDCTTRLYTGTRASVTSSISGSSLNGSDYEMIELRRASTILEENKVDRIAILKIDTEGAEVPILRDIEHLLDRVDVIFLEYHSEADRVEIDHLLNGRFALFNGTVELHRGNLGYVAKDVIAEMTAFDQAQIARPTF